MHHSILVSEIKQRKSLVKVSPVLMILTAFFWRKGTLFSVELYLDLETVASCLEKAKINPFKKCLLSKRVSLGER